MNEIVPTKAVRRAKRLAVHRQRSDNEFLPAALEIIETPASPTQMALIVIICLFASATLAWSYVGRIDIFAVATGKIRPASQVKVIQPLETGRVRAFNVANGTRVHAGDILLELDPTEAMADANELSVSLASYRAEILRRNAVIAVAQDGGTDFSPTINWPEDIPSDIRSREDRVLEHDIGSLRAQIRSLEAQKSEKLAEQASLKATTQAEANLIQTLQQRVDLRNALIADNTGTKSTLIDALQSLQDEEATFATDHGQLEQTAASLDTLAAEKQKTLEAFKSENAQKLADAERQADDLAQRLVKARAATSHMTLASPIDGIVQGLAVTTIGQVVTTGQQVMRIVPDNTPLEIEAYAENKDIGFVHEGQQAIIKIESFPFTRYGTLNGTVTSVARDSIPSSDAQVAENDPTQLAKSNTNNTSVGQTQNLVYPVIITPSKAAIRADGREVPLSAGMTVTVEIKTGSRRLLEYVFSPLIEVESEAMRER
ncbi:HlyD family type I secretion periplasmic adaptor subunit [Rhizobium sp. CNPSo 4039]|uniref:HlyD family type I secretion periplasmic adaptor subunit n=1 Tax=Rhizobium sp. CNPSo 4039 TaxID=3021409 RepID=UPI002550B41C|nr:HlyD family type I secretion periplasmic adaptor subunit [Rhizobium sp. CNPSo 4039]MDK4715915.1 HlyD family type I secretion periplasmic adaptor subunit [Rhizobium sp. CNPSo 4039]